jgi:hypothetical protein
MVHANRIAPPPFCLAHAMPLRPGLCHSQPCATVPLITQPFSLSWIANGEIRPHHQLLLQFAYTNGDMHMLES